MISQIPKFNHLSTNWTVQTLVSMAKMSISNIEAETYPLPVHMVRLLSNQAIAGIEDVIMIDSQKDYTITYDCSIDVKDGMQYIDMSKAIFLTPQRHGEVLYSRDTYVASKHINAVMGIYSPSGGIFIERTLEELIGVNTQENSLYDQSILWARNGDRILLYIGKDREIDSTTIKMVAVRKPVLDDLKIPRRDNWTTEAFPTLFSETYHAYIDVPDKYVKLLSLQLKKECLEYLSQPIPEELESKIASIIQALSADKQMQDRVSQQMEDKVK